jgi:tRNA(Ile2) C34 agmatinyltransferase TiaS
MVETPMQPQPRAVECPRCGARTRLYRTPRGLRCAECVKLMDSAGLGFR